MVSSRELSSYVLSASLFCLAAALVYFAYEASSISRQIPAILAAVEGTSAEIDPVVKEVAKITEQLPHILDEVAEVRQLVPPILNEVSETRKMVPSVLAEIEKTRLAIPPILSEVQQTRKDLPAVLKTVDTASQSVAMTASEMKAYRPLVPEVLKQVELTREAINPALDRVDELIAKAGAAGKQASKGAVTGLFTGILTLPFSIVGDVGKSVAGMGESSTKFTEKDIEQFKKARNDILKNGHLDETREWTNPDSGTKAKITLLKIFESNNEECRRLRVQIWDADKKEDYDNTANFCRDAQGVWKVVKEPSQGSWSDNF
jgi:surface antigen